MKANSILITIAAIIARTLLAIIAAIHNTWHFVVAYVASFWTYFWVLKFLTPKTSTIYELLIIMMIWGFVNFVFYGVLAGLLADIFKKKGE